MQKILNLLTDKQKKLVYKEIKEEGYCVLQRWINKKGELDYRVLKDTIIVTPDRIYDKIKWMFKRMMQ